MPSPLISIVVPTLEEEKCIGGMLGQFPHSLRERCNLELIISDGGSTDKTVQFARAAADAVVQANSTQTISLGRNAGARVARGEILVFFNADVRVADPENFIKEMRRTFEDKSVVAATCNVRVIPEDERLADKLFHRGYNWHVWFMNSIGMGMGRGECHVIRRSMFDCLGGYNEHLVAGEDCEFFVRLRRAGKVAFVRSLTVYESPRRYRAFGYVRTNLLWSANAIGALFFKRSFSKRWPPVR
ncbi:MAG TPA: glycosyltransferase [Bacteroidota bacterium]|nr:glycosyltransferase [Bacteroidota bacterium]